MNVKKPRNLIKEKLKGEAGVKLLRHVLAGIMVIFMVLPMMSQAQSPKDHVAALKETLAKSQVLLRQYEWVETTVVMVNDEEKSRTVYRCYYGPDGKLYKLQISTPPPQQKAKGIRGKIMAKKKEEMNEYMQSAVNLVKSYIPPDPASIDTAKNAGNMSIIPKGPVVRINFRDYKKQGDMLTIDIDMKNSTLFGLQVASWLENAEDKVSLVSNFGILSDGATYTADSTLTASGKSLKVKITNTDYRKR